MDYRRTSLAQNRKQQTNSTSHTYASFAGANGTARNTNGILADSTTMWWDEERIESTVTRQFVLSKLRPDEAERLDQPLGFGDGLTDDTYWDWIESKSKRIFLILVDLDVPDQIFGVIDDSWDDDDLPVPLDQVERLQLTFSKDEKLEKKFFYRQFTYLLRNIPKGENVYYDDEEVVPLELAEKRPVGAVTGLTHSSVDKVHLPGRPDDVFIRRRIPLGAAPGQMPPAEFLSGIEAMKAIEHEHLTCLWASYIHQGCGYLLLTPANDSTLKAFLTVTPQSMKIMAKQDRRILLLNWIHCLADALAFLHRQGLSHRNIKPSNIMLDVDNHIFLGDTGIFTPSNLSTGEKRGFDKETYDYSAPEQAPRPPTTVPIHLPVSRPSTTRSINGSLYPTITSPTANSSPDTASIQTTSTSSQNSNAPKHDPQKSDVYSLGAIFLEIITFLLKRASRNFASHRSAKNKTPGRGGGLPDSSFHKNRAQVEGWMAMLAKDASKKEDKVFRGLNHILALVEKMLSPNPEERPTAQMVQERLYTILSEHSGLGAPLAGCTGKIHCELRAIDAVSGGDFNFGFDQMLASQRAAAEACANVNPTATALTQLSLGNGGTIYGIEKVESPAVYERREGDRASISTGKSRSSEGKMSRLGSGSGSGSAGSGAKPKPKAKAWQAPVYAGMILSKREIRLKINADKRNVELSFG
ncbi:Spindle assembly checkpoint kinase [Hyphodiscus hymeniophilus]|uniref:Spindle assembly checkpoint kinase n=1 Tax=Hyphodiscus hymeniophilus TaxID=353542 RepID=A0A9P6VRX1_9HELO|nr:Spindle assembly checkpoint kinase [Hyphodiscus hymeniophilus]